MSISQEKFSKLNALRKDTHRAVANAISQLNAHTDAAIKQQLYMRLNPDDNGADSLIPVVTPDFVATATAFNEVKAKLEDMQAVAAGTMTAEELATKYNVDIIAFSAELI